MEGTERLGVQSQENIFILSKYRVLALNGSRLKLTSQIDGFTVIEEFEGEILMYIGPNG